jgi:hypothetical protein
VPGRHLNALLTAESVLGLKIDEQAIENHARAAFFAFGGPLPLSLNREQKEGLPLRFMPHNVREGFHALYALVKYRRNEKARQLAESCIECIFQYWNPEKGWDIPALDRAGVHYDTPPPDTFITGIGRAIGPLVKYYRATGSGRALELAQVLAEKATTDYFRADGEYDGPHFGSHTHSTTSVMSGLAQLAEMLGYVSLLERVKAFYDKGLWAIRDQLGWVIENSNRTGPTTDMGEINNTGDILETALILGRHGFPEYYGDAERILRCHLLPAQLRDNSFIRDLPNPKGEDGLRNIADRHRGAFGFPAPYGHLPAGVNNAGFNMDIVGGAIGSLCEAYQHIARQETSGLWINLHFDYQDDLVRVESPYTSPCLRITVTRSVPLRVRLPSWVNPDEPMLRVVGLSWSRLDHYLFFSQPVVGMPMEIAFPLPSQELVLKHATHDIRVRMHGDEVEAMDNFGADLTYFESYEPFVSA